MKHHQYNPEFKFVEEPEEFNKHSEKNFLQYCLGATLYMPGTKKFSNAILNKDFPGLTSMVMCFEDAIEEGVLPEAEQNVLDVLEHLTASLDDQIINLNDLPLIFLRVRNTEQFFSFSKKLNSDHVKSLTGFVFPKFSSDNGDKYLNQLKLMNETFSNVLYAMPILEGKEIAFKETRTQELIGIKKLIKPFEDLILNIRIGATDLSSIFGVRRGINYSIYEILPVRDCLADILNFFNRSDDNLVLSAPVWEYFLADKKMKFEDVPDSYIHSSLIKRNTIIDEAVDGLLREVILDKANGFVGKTVIHPTHIKYVNAMNAVTKEEYEDAVQILNTSGGVIKSTKSNKMNEINPHRSWAGKIYNKARAYGVLEGESDYVHLFS